MADTPARTLLDPPPPGPVIVTPTAMVPRQEPEGLALVIERLASNPSVDVDKLERIIALQERILAHESKAAFDAAMSEVQSEMRRVSADASNPQTHSRYASYAALDRELRPIYTKHGFSLSFDTAEGAPAEWVRVVCEVAHRCGFSRPYHVDMPADGKGAKGGDVMTKTHATGSALSYAMRYLLKMIFNVAVGEDDDDGNAAGQKKAEKIPDPPEGFESWADDMTSAAQEGTTVFTPAWEKSKEDFTKYALKYRRALTEGWKATVKAANAALKAASHE